jgi:hypothetical protein
VRNHQPISDSAAVDLGPGVHKFDVFIDVTACELASNRLHVVSILGSNDATSESVPLAALLLGCGESTQSTYDRGVGEYVIHCSNVGPDVDGVPTTYRHVRLASDVTTGLALTARVSKSA